MNHIRKNITFSDIREYVYKVYLQRSYDETIDYIKMLRTMELITVDDRTQLTDFINVLELNKKSKKRWNKI